MGSRILTWLLLIGINKDNKGNTAITNTKPLSQDPEEVIINVELELELTEDK
ncbi:hypothetical protein [Vulcanisaeta souniana]|uniref:Uncharacterized protein n=1 Tax=Vulcanisaeta souniana JCM 11219 TaxID=1293586 RepID=A0A830EGM6_9CREN|nr:hypothetical protein [Vulcanisaeta souniana]BDR91924.1 hypothetical protein Vsou_10170 [Vulcanisaeta souniana JCM 11219]GGI69327.1 hypothetical protein GCM10007112_02870 [Vulcanisaeta souniana JCM 11219]